MTCTGGLECVSIKLDTHFTTYKTGALSEPKDKWKCELSGKNSFIMVIVKDTNVHLGHSIWEIGWCKVFVTYLSLLFIVYDLR